MVNIMAFNDSAHTVEHIDNKHVLQTNSGKVRVFIPIYDMLTTKQKDMMHRFCRRHLGFLEPQVTLSLNP